MVKIKQSNVENAHLLKFNCIKQGFHGRNTYPKGNLGLIEAIKARKQLIKSVTNEVILAPGINPYKQVELNTNYGPLLPEERRSMGIH